MVKKEQRLSTTIRDVSPCCGCTERFTACHDRCPKDERGEFGHKAWLAKVRDVQAKQKAYNDLNRRKRWQR